MKVVFRTTLLFALTISLFSCKTKDTSYKGFYKEINRYHMEGMNFNTLDPIEEQAKRTPKSSCCGEDDPVMQAYIKNITDNLDAMNNTLDALDKTACVRVPDSDEAQPTAAAAGTTSNQPAAQTSTVATPAQASVKSASNLPKDVRRMKVAATSPSDAASLKQFSVVAATFAKSTNAEILKKRLRAENEQAIVVKNATGNYYLISGSYDTEAEAVNRIEEIFTTFVAKYPSQSLMNKYGVPLSDTWILMKE